MDLGKQTEAKPDKKGKYSWTEIPYRNKGYHKGAASRQSPGAVTVTQGTLTCSASLLIKDNPSSAELSQPLVNTRSNPREIRVSNATRGSCTMSKAER